MKKNFKKLKLNIPFFRFFTAHLKLKFKKRKNIKLKLNISFFRFLYTFQKYIFVFIIFKKRKL